MGGDDYEALGDSVTIPDGQASVDVVIAVLDDDQVEGLEEVVLTLVADQPYVIAGPFDTVTVNDDDGFIVSIAATDADAGEPDNPGTFTITRSGGTLGELVVPYSIGGTADPGADYAEIATSVTILGGQESAIVVINIVNDNEVEGPEDVILSLTEDPAYLIDVDDSAAIIIEDDDQFVVSIVATESDAREPSGSGLFTVTRTGGADGDLTVHYLIGGTANNSADYATISDSAIILDGEFSTTIAIDVLDDEFGERVEDVVLTLVADPHYAVGSTGSDRVTITDEGLLVAFGDGAAKSVSYIDPDGTLGNIRVKKASGSVFFWGDGFATTEGKKGIMVTGDNVAIGTLSLMESSPKTTLSIKAKGGADNHVDADHLFIVGSAKKIKANRTDLIESLQVGGSLQALILDDIAGSAVLTTDAATAKGMKIKAGQIHTGAVFDLTGHLKNLKALSYTGGSLSADSVGNLTTKREIFSANVQAATGGIGKINALGDITGKIIAEDSIGSIISRKGNLTGVARSGNEIGSVKALKFDGALLSAGTNVNRVQVKGDMIDTHILAGYDIGIDGVLGLQAPGGGDVAGSGDVRSVRVKGEFIRSYIGAGVLPLSSLTAAALPDMQLPFVSEAGMIGKVKFGGVDLDATVDFGLFAGSDIAPFKIGKLTAESIDYFNV